MIVKTSGRVVDGPIMNVISFYIKIYVKPFVGPKLGPTRLVGASTILPDVFTITIPSYLLGSFYYSIYFYSFSIRIDPKTPKIH